MTVIVVALVTLVGTAAGALVTYLLGRRTKSGKIDTTEAAQLWVESQAMRKELRDEVVDLRAEVRALKVELTECKTELAGCKTEAHELRQELADTRGDRRDAQGHE